MWLRMIVNTWIRQQGGQVLRNLVAEALRGEPLPKSPRTERPGSPGSYGSHGSHERPDRPGGATRPDQPAGSPRDADRRLPAAALHRGDDPAEANEYDDEPAPPPPPPRPPCVAAFLFAMELEAAGLVERLTETVTTQGSSFTEHDGFLEGERVLVGITGVGAEAAWRAASDFLAVHRPPWVVSAGFAGGLVDTVRRGHFLMPQAIVSQGGAPRGGMPPAETEFAVGLRFPRRDARKFEVAAHRPPGVSRPGDPRRGREAAAGKALRRRRLRYGIMGGGGRLRGGENPLPRRAGRDGRRGRPSASGN